METSALRQSHTRVDPEPEPSTPPPAFAPELIPLASDDDLEGAREWLIRTLGATVCRQLGIYPIPEDLVLSVVIPVYNERNTLKTLVDKVRAVPIRKQIILVDDCSRDATTELLREWQKTEPDLTIGFHEE